MAEEQRATKQSPDQQAAKPPARKYKPILSGEFIERCSYVLPNRLQCWKSGEEVVTLGDTVYQLCERHARIQKALDAGLLKEEQVSTTYKGLTLDPPVVVQETDVPEDTEKEKDIKNRQETGAKNQEGQPLSKEQAANEPSKSTTAPKEEETKHQGFFHREEKR